MSPKQAEEAGNQEKDTRNLKKSLLEECENRKRLALRKKSRQACSAGPVRKYEKYQG
jgi:hypothetical protein